MLAAVMMCLVVGVVDGDTIDVRCGEPGAYQQIRVRVNAIDAPESKQAFGQASKRSVSDLCYMQQAKLAPNNTKTYERIVASVECRGKDLAAHQVQNGLAWVYPQYAKKRQDLYPLQNSAKTAGAGLWSMPNQVEPWRFRHGGK